MKQAGGEARTLGASRRPAAPTAWRPPELRYGRVSSWAYRALRKKINKKKKGTAKEQKTRRRRGGGAAAAQMREAAAPLLNKPPSNE